MRRGGLGIDVGARLLHCVELDAGGAVVRAEAIAVHRFGELIGWAARVGSVAIDAPSGPSTQVRPKSVETLVARRSASVALVPSQITARKPIRPMSASTL